MSHFMIVLPSELEEWPSHDLSMVVREERTRLQYAIGLFCEKFFGNAWYIQVGQTKYWIDIHDIIFIWDQLPELLQHISEDPTDQVQFSFQAQGFNTILVAQATSTSELSIVVLTDQNSPSLFSFNSSQSIHDALSALIPVKVSVKSFIDSWKDLAKNVIEMLVANQIIDADDRSIFEYFDELPS